MAEKIVNLDCFRKEKGGEDLEQQRAMDEVKNAFNFMNNISALMMHHGFLVHRLIYTAKSHYCFVTNPDTNEKFYAQVAFSDGNPVLQTVKKEIGPLDLFQTKSCKTHRMMTAVPVVLLGLTDSYKNVRVCLNGEGFLNYISTETFIVLLADDGKPMPDLCVINAKDDELSFSAFRYAVDLAKENNLVIKDFKISESFTLFNPITDQEQSYKFADMEVCDRESKVNDCKK